MTKFRPGLIAILVFCALFTTDINSEPYAGALQSNLSAQDKSPQFDKMMYIAGNSYVPKGASEVLQASHEKYLEGRGRMQAGESEKARILFNEAVDLLLSPDWDTTSTLHLNHFFQDLVQRIPIEKSLYRSSSGKNSGINLTPLAISPEFQDDFASLLGDNRYEIPITINKTVAKSLYYWLNDGRHDFIEGWVRSGKYRAIIERIFREENVPLDLMYLAQVESLFKPTAFSKALAKGIWQFNKSTAIQYGLKVTQDIDERSDTEKSTRAAARYLKDLYAAFGDWNLALAAYNWGGARVKKLVQQTGINDFWELVDTGRGLPMETKNHVPLIHASIVLARNPEKFGLPLQLDPPLDYVEVSVSKPIDLRAAAEVLNTTLRALQKLNPSLRGLSTPAQYPDYRLKVPADSDVNLRERLVALSAMQNPS
ncbi:MAG: lytic transglycosylase domain-containing protein [Acidobacteria bacterium]|nr:lytic transglycosylase domain-containing protein [Acidobacteriota bacterium]